ncbi:MAG TPA: hypothetical protein VF623_14255 [Segetibacter sp.]
MKITLISSIVVSTGCCNVKEETSNSVFQEFSPTSKEYKNKLAVQLKANAKGLYYTFNKLVSINGKEYLDIEVKGDEFKATGLVLVNNWNKLEGIKRTKGQGYSGAQLRGLILDVQESPSGANLLYNDLEEIID